MLHKFLSPFNFFYWLITDFRNLLFDAGVLKSTRFKVPIIVVGNLSMGGTGKTPQIEYLIRLLSTQYKIATLSRGYGRKTKGFVLADSKANAQTIGDEPFQFYNKFPEIQVAVSEDRVKGIQQLLSRRQPPGVILLDDAFQHRKVKAGLYILLTAYEDLYVDDFLLPAGNLRESKKGASRADVVIVTKCPKDLSEESQDKIRKKLKKYGSAELYFTYIEYDEFVYSENDKISVKDLGLESSMLLAGIANPTPFLKYLDTGRDSIMTYADHYNFSQGDIDEILARSLGSNIITTEKDYMRLKGSDLSRKLYYLPIKSEFISNQDNFNSIILNYIKKYY